MPQIPTVFKTYQDVKNNLVYWTIILLVGSTGVVLGCFLTPLQRAALLELATTHGSNSLLSALLVAVLLGLYVFLAYVLIYAFQIHDALYDRHIIRWRETYDVEFILRQLVEPFKEQLPGNFLDFARKYRDDFMVPYYHFVGDRGNRIQENARIRFYERVTMYWTCELNELFLVFFLLFTPLFILFVSEGSFTVRGTAIYFFVLAGLIILNRGFIRRSLGETSKATRAEIDEILEKPENRAELLQRFTNLCSSHHL